MLTFSLFIATGMTHFAARNLWKRKRDTFLQQLKWEQRIIFAIFGVSFVVSIRNWLFMSETRFAASLESKLINKVNKVNWIRFWIACFWSCPPIFDFSLNLLSGVFVYCSKKNVSRNNHSTFGPLVCLCAWHFFFAVESIESLEICQVIISYRNPN